MACRCDELKELRGNEAERYASKHLEREAVDEVGWTKRFSCPETGAGWLMDFPEAHLQGGGPPRLRRLDA